MKIGFLRSMAAATVLLLSVFNVPSALAADGAPEPPPDLATVCPSADPPSDPGTFAGAPGNWSNPKRFGTAWSLNFLGPASNQSLLLFWQTFKPINSSTHRPVWLQTNIANIVTAPNGERTWSANLYSVKYNFTSLTTSSTLVGDVMITFPADSATRAAIGWKWNAIGSQRNYECIYDIYRGHAGSAPTTETLSQSHTNNWTGSVNGNWAINLGVGVISNGTYSEQSLFNVYDTNGDAVWLTSEASAANWLPSSWQERPVFYRSGKVGYQLTADCSAAECAPAVPLNSASGFYGRAFESTLKGIADLRISIGGIPNTPGVVWPPQGWQVVPPSQVPACPAGRSCQPLISYTNSDIVTVSQTSCQVAVGANSCSIDLSWSTPQSSAKVYRIDAQTHIAAPITTPYGSAGQQAESIPTNKQYYFELRVGTTVLATSAVVTALPPANPPDTPPAPTPFQEPTLDSTSDTVGAVNGEFRVDEGGNATYHIPLFAPRGKGGLTPQVALSYNSAGGEGELGSGFSLNSVSSIQKCRSGTEFGDTQAISSDLNQFCLDGQRLLLWKGLHMQAGAEYRTEIESFQRIVLNEVQTIPAAQFGTTAAIPTYWFTVYGKDGTVRHFGAAAGTVVSAGASLGTFRSATAINWLQTDLIDASGNTINYSYSSQGGSGTLISTGERDLSSVSYVGGSLGFQYVASGRRDVSHSSGGDAVRSRLLSGVTVYGADSSVLRQYSVSYANAFSGSLGFSTLTRPRVTDIRECADVALGICYPATHFDWQDVSGSVDVGNSDTPGFNHFPGLISHRLADFNGDGRADIVWVNTAKELRVNYSVADSNGINFTKAWSPTVTLSGVDPVGAFQSLDFDGDGYDDLIFLSQSATNSSKVSWYLRRSTGAGFLPAEVLLSDVGFSSSGDTLKYESTLADHTGDGLPDLVFRVGAESLKIAVLERVEGNLDRPYRFAAPINVRLIDDPLSGISQCAVSTYTVRRDEERGQVVDVDGDGRSDLRYMSTSSACNSGTVIGSAVAGKDEPEFEDAPGTPMGTPVNYYFVTYRADKIVSTRDSQEFQFVRSGRTVRVTENLSENSREHARQRVISADVNGDGFMDIVYLNDQNQWRSNLTVSDQTYGYDVCVANCLTNNHTDKVQLLDYDGDGKLDFWWPDSSTAQRNYQVYLWKGDGFVSTPINTGFIAREGNDWTRLSADYDGDGLVDNLVIKAFDGANPDGVWGVHRSVSHHKARGVVTGITNGLGATTNIDYSPMTFASVYRRDYDGSVRNWGRGSPVFDLSIPNFVVHYVGSSAPTAGSPTAQSIVQYQYRGLKMQSGGRGALGFRRVSTIDLQTAIAIDTYNLTEFPFVGMPIQTMTRRLTLMPTDLCRPNGVLTDYAPGCMTHTPTCSSGKLHMCDDSIVDPNAKALKTQNDVLGWRFQPQILSDAAGGRELYAYNQSMSSVPAPPAGPTPSIFVVRYLSGTYDFDYLADGTKLYNSYTSFGNNTFGFDDFGNPLQSKVLSRKVPFGPAGTEDTVVTTESRNSYANDPNTWKLGRLATSTTFTTRVETKGGIASTTTLGRRASFSYVSATNPGDTRGLLSSERVEGMLGTSVDALVPDTATRGVVTYYELDNAGNRIGVATCSADISETQCRSMRAGNANYSFHLNGQQVMRYSRNTYDALQRYADNTIEAVSSGGDLSTERELASVLARNAGGDVTDAQDANGVIARSRYGRLGRKRFDYTSAGGSVRSDWIKCTSSLCPQGKALAYLMKTTASGAPMSWVFYDLLGRPTVSVQQGFAANEYISSITEYDSRGNVTRQSEPFFAAGVNSSAATPKSGVVPVWTTTQFDSLNRPTRIDAPDYGITTKSYSSMTTITALPPNLNGERQGVREIRNGLGEVMSTEDSNLLAVEFSYDAAGNVLRVTRNGKVTTSTYDTLGRKLSTYDPDAGLWRYKLNDAGEVIQQISPRNTCTAQKYDGRGRLWKREDYSDANCSTSLLTASATWQFDTALYGIGKLANEQSTEVGAVAVQRNYSYNSVGQSTQVQTIQDGKSYLTQATFDQYGRPFQGFFAATNLPTTGEKNEYNAQGYAYRVRSAYPGGTGAIYYEALETNARGQVTRERKAIGTEIVTTREFDPATGRLKAQRVQNGALQDLSYDYDQLGNVTYRQSNRVTQSGSVLLRETFNYDILQRLTGSTITRNGTTNGATSQVYDLEGNILYKNGQGYVYGALPASCTSVSGAVSPGPHAVSTAGGTNYCYDANGNAIRIVGGGDDRTLSYTSYDLVREVRSNVKNTKTGYEYGPNREKVRRRSYASAGAVTTSSTTEYVGGAEIRWIGGVIDEVRRYAGAVIVIQRNPGSGYVTSYQYLLTDAQGSTDLVLDILGMPVNPNAAMSFDAFGQRRDVGAWNASTPWSTSLSNDLDATTRHGYTGHEQADEVGIIHMNGRIYDPALGRFLQADPFVQSPGNSQSHNRYSYVFNNPMAYTDPTGYFGSKERSNVRTGVAIAVSFFLPGALTSAGLSATQAAVITGAVAGGIQSGNARGAAVGALSALAFSGIASKFDAAAAAGGGVASQSSIYAARALSNGAAGGVMSMLEGGRFGHGFISAGLGTYLAPASGFGSDNPVLGSLAAAAAGGTLSAISGGSFANGAMTGAFRFTFGRAMEGSAGDDSISLARDVTVTGCTRSEGSLPAPAGPLGLLPDYLTQSSSSGRGNPSMDRAIQAAIVGLPDSDIGEWTGFVRWRGPGYQASVPVLVVAQPSGKCFQATFSIPGDADGIYHTHMKYSRSVRGYKIQNAALNQNGPKDHWTLYRSRPIPNYFRGANHSITAVESPQYLPQFYTLRGL